MRDLLQRGEVGARAEVLPCSRDHNHSNAIIPRCVLQPTLEPRDQGIIQRITFLWTVQRNPRHRTFDRVKNCLIRVHRLFNSAASASLSSISIRSNAVEKVFPCASVINDKVPPPPRLSCNRKLSAPRFGNSNRSTSP